MNATYGPAERTAWIALASTPGVGDCTFTRLLDAYGSARDALEAVTRLPSSGSDRPAAVRRIGYQPISFAPLA